MSPYLGICGFVSRDTWLEGEITSRDQLKLMEHGSIPRAVFDVHGNLLHCIVSGTAGTKQHDEAGVWGLQVHLLARGDKLRASRAMQDRALDHKKVTVHFNTAVDDAYPDGKGALAGLHIKDTKSGHLPHYVVHIHVTHVLS